MLHDGEGCVIPERQDNQITVDGITPGSGRDRVGPQVRCQLLGLFARVAEQLHAVAAGQGTNGNASGHVAGADDGDGAHVYPSEWVESGKVAAEGRFFPSI